MAEKIREDKEEQDVEAMDEETLEVDPGLELENARVHRAVLPSEELWSLPSGVSYCNFRRLRGTVVVVTTMSWSSFKDLGRKSDFLRGQASQVDHMHIEELNELRSRFSQTQLEIVLVLVDEPWKRKARTKEQRKSARQRINQIVRKCGITFHVSLPVHVNGAFCNPLFKFLKSQSRASHDIEGNFESYFVVDGTGIPAGRFEDISPSELECEIRMLV